MTETSRSDNAVREIKECMVRALDSRPDDAELGRMMADSILEYDGIFSRYPVAYETFCGIMAGKYGEKTDAEHFKYADYGK